MAGHLGPPALCSTALRPAASCPSFLSCQGVWQMEGGGEELAPVCAPGSGGGAPAGGVADF